MTNPLLAEGLIKCIYLTAKEKDNSITEEQTKKIMESLVEIQDKLVEMNGRKK